ncbi:potassium channel family protein [Formosa algae]|uniref:Trk system potassium uptake protein TrkA n=1 Tax=Formosa algae TaxID=225843 RepID=A0A9X1CAT9_9FLAO|nr:TrkA family potassium uptake protein [Formosa algae]MBP1838520.1 trk system potassium uptake protein TrkA [Formosa algae]MDQ0335020.1 trk system potassium uptake protein TrkA [Formosa algae]OEI79639.1 potassium transporter TrkA [Formosa algae]PNW30217.1 potassium transporter TrkA [Formosa algae]
MKIIIFGLGNFGMSLALSLTETGNEVVGIDKQMEKVNIVKDKIAHSICLDSTNELAYQSLPIKQTDIAVVAIGENEGAAIITTAILKKLTTAKVISRSLSPIHDTVLQAMGITSIVHPEQEAALKLTNKINLKNIIDSFKIDEKYSISEIKTPIEFVGKSISDLDFRSKQKLNIITILRKKEKVNLIGNTTFIKEVIGIPGADTVIQDGDILVVFGLNDDISKICHKH